jgi:hypothetical protein
MIKFILIVIVIIIILKLYYDSNRVEHFGDKNPGKSSLFYEKRKPQPNPKLFPVSYDYNNTTNIRLQNPVKNYGWHDLDNLEYSSVQNNRIFTNNINTTNNIKRDDQYNKPNKLITESLIKEVIAKDNILEEDKETLLFI